MRLFFGVKISMESVRAVSEAVARMREAADEEHLRVRWVAPATYHVTLKFLGEARAEVVPAVRDAIAEALADEPELSFTVRGAGAFPNEQAARVLWMGVDDPGGNLARLALACDEAVEPLGFKREKRAFHAHVTVGRLKQVANVERLVLRCTEQESSRTRATRVTLFESVMKSSGSEYFVHEEWPLRQTAPVEPTSGITT
jgi:2'-5' RNA ligase